MSHLLRAHAHALVGDPATPPLCQQYARHSDEYLPGGEEVSVSTSSDSRSATSLTDCRAPVPAARSVPTRSYCSISDAAPAAPSMSPPTRSSHHDTSCPAGAGRFLRAPHPGRPVVHLEQVPPPLEMPARPAPGHRIAGSVRSTSRLATDGKTPYDIEFTFPRSAASFEASRTASRCTWSKARRPRRISSVDSTCIGATVERRARAFLAFAHPATISAAGSRPPPVRRHATAAAAAPPSHTTIIVSARRRAHPRRSAIPMRCAPYGRAAQHVHLVDDIPSPRPLQAHVANAVVIASSKPATFVVSPPSESVHRLQRLLAVPDGPGRTKSRRRSLSHCSRCAAVGDRSKACRPPPRSPRQCSGADASADQVPEGGPPRGSRTLLRRLFLRRNTRPAP